MTNEEFKKEFKRLCDGFSYEPRQPQVDAFFERLQRYERQDWHEAVTDLLCAPKFPFNLEVILDTIEKRADQRRRVISHRLTRQDNALAARLETHSSMQEAFREKPELMAPLLRILRKED